MNQNNKVYIVGAGPGDPELLTIKAFNCLKKAEVVLYDELFGDEILNLLPDNCERIYAGKRHCDTQSQTERQNRINQLMLEHFRKNKNVVRLKTGDPLIFGRGIEEIRYLVANDVAYEVVPGISAGIASANLLSIPLTERNKNTAVLFCTGHTIDGSIDQLIDLACFLKKGNPVIVYMGLKNLSRIIGVLIEQGVENTTNICVASKISHPGQRLVEGNFDNIIQKLEESPLEFPAVVIMGKYAETVKK